MMRKAGLTALWMTIIAACMPDLPARAAQEDLDGFWIDSDGEVIIEVVPCGAARCGRVAWLKQPDGADGLPLRDVKNADPNLKSRPVCGLEVVSAFKKQSDGTWGDGTVYVSDQGASYSGKAEIISATQIKVTGFIGFAIFGESEIWAKVTSPFQRCVSTKLDKPAADKTPAANSDGAKSDGAKSAVAKPSGPGQKPAPNRAERMP